ncbi:MAG: PaaX family transcriptional regulator, partial [Spirillospora sp.]
RSATEGWLAGERRGRRTAWRLTPSGVRLLTDGAERVCGFGRPVGDWDGQWLVVLATVPETSRRLRHLLRTRLAWSGLGNLSPGVWVSPHPDREAEVREVLAEIGVAETSTLFVGRLGDLSEARRVAGRAWDLDEIELAYANFLRAVQELSPTGDSGTFVVLTRLVQEWRRFPLVDPGLPAELLPDDWSGAQAAALARERHDAWRPAAERQWRSLSDG